MRTPTSIAFVDPRPVDCQFYSLGLVPYQPARVWQQGLVQERVNCPSLPDVFILLEHPPVYTLGRGADAQFLKFDPRRGDREVHRVERGGEVTYHCPGQLVGYPILNLRRHRTDLHWYLRQLEEVLIRTLAVWGVAGDRIPGLTGVWVGDTKVAAIGIKVSRWISMHGFALNVCPDLAGFEAIVPCGISDKAVGSLAQFVPDIAIADVREVLATQFAEVFGVRIVPAAGVSPWE
jgi:lipoyl(octanoyl) transferase